MLNIHQNTSQKNTLVQSRRHLYALQDAAADILGQHHPVSSCLRRAVAGGVTVVHDGKSARYSNLCTCKNTWVCPHCQRRILAHRRGEIEAVLHKEHERGIDALFVTVTIQHHAGSKLAELINTMLAAWRSVFSGDRSGARQCFTHVAGQIKALEVRYGTKNGWHPHLHLLILVNHAGMDATEAALLDEKIADTIYARYAAAVERRGMSTERAAYNCQTVTDLAGGVSKYIQKFEAALELTTSGTKSSQNSYSPWQLLALYNKDADAKINGTPVAALFREYHGATKKRRQISFSRGLLDTKEDAEIEEAELKEAVTLAVIDLPLWRHICRYHLRADVLEVADYGSAEYLANYLESIRAGDASPPGR
jgi:hypothetical protein